MTPTSPHVYSDIKNDGTNTDRPTVPVVRQSVVALYNHNSVIAQDNLGEGWEDDSSHQDVAEVHHLWVEEGVQDRHENVACLPEN